MKFTNQNNKYIIKNVLIWREIMCCVTLLDGYIYDLAEFIFLQVRLCEKRKHLEAQLK